MTQRLLSLSLSLSLPRALSLSRVVMRRDKEVVQMFAQNTCDAQVYSAEEQRATSVCDLSY